MFDDAFELFNSFDKCPDPMNETTFQVMKFSQKYYALLLIFFFYNTYFPTGEGQTLHAFVRRNDKTGKRS